MCQIILPMLGGAFASGLRFVVDIVGLYVCIGSMAVQRLAGIRGDLCSRVAPDRKECASSAENCEDEAHYIID